MYIVTLRGYQLAVAITPNELYTDVEYLGTGGGHTARDRFETHNGADHNELVWNIARDVLFGLENISLKDGWDFGTELDAAVSAAFADVNAC